MTASKPHSDLFETVRSALWVDGQPELVYTSALASANMKALDALKRIEEQYEDLVIRADERSKMIEEYRDVNRNYAGSLEDALHEIENLKQRLVRAYRGVNVSGLENKIQKLEEQFEALKVETDADAAAWEEMRQYNIRLEDRDRELREVLQELWDYTGRDQYYAGPLKKKVEALLASNPASRQEL